jgi:hypothetical protein
LSLCVAATLCGRVYASTSPMVPSAHCYPSPNPIAYVTFG